MTIQQFHDWFNILTDHYNEPYFIDSEIDGFINAGALEFVNDIVFKEFFPSVGQNEKGVQLLNGLETSSQSGLVLQPLILNDLTVISDSNGIITSSVLSQAIQDKISEEADCLYLLKINDTDLNGFPIKYIRNNDINSFNQNVFKRPKETKPVFTLTSDGIQIYPKLEKEFNVSLVKSPKIASLENDENIDLPSFTHQRVLAYALSLSGIASRDEIMLQLQQASGNGTNRIQG